MENPKIKWETQARAERLYGLDCGRGLAALVVLFTHWQHFFFVGTSKIDFAWEAVPFFSLLSSLYFLGHHGVGFFFMLSGFIFFLLYGEPIAKRKISAKEFFILRLSRIYPLHFLTLIVAAVSQFIYIYYVGKFYVYPVNDTQEFVEHVFLVASWFPGSRTSLNGPAWSLSIEFGFYIGFFLMAYFRLNRWWMCAAVLAWSLPPTIENLFNIRMFSISHFAIGGLLYFVLRSYMNSTLRSKATDSAILSVTAALLVATFYKPFYLFLYWETVLFILTAFPLFIASLVILEKPLKRCFKKLRLFGDLSFSVYLIHFPLQLIITLTLGLIGYNAGQYMCQPHMFFLYFIFLYFLGFLSFKYFERPIQQMIRKRFIQKNRVLKRNSDYLKENDHPAE